MVGKELPEHFAFPHRVGQKLDNCFANDRSTVVKNFEYALRSDRDRIKNYIIDSHQVLTWIYIQRNWLINYCLRDVDPDPYTPPEPPGATVPKTALFIP